MIMLTLPKKFEALDPFVSQWALATQNQRQQKRISSSRGELQAFYDAMLPNIEGILKLADEYPLGKIPSPAYELYCMALSLAEIAPHVELYGGDPKVPHSFDEARFVAEHGEVAA
jgi:hypothetical protein